jgi:hypothetical protein
MCDKQTLNFLPFNLYMVYIYSKLLYIIPFEDYQFLLVIWVYIVKIKRSSDLLLVLNFLKKLKNWNNEDNELLNDIILYLQSAINFSNKLILIEHFNIYMTDVKILNQTPDFKNIKFLKYYNECVEFYNIKND